MARGGGAVPLHRAGLSRDRRGPGGAVLGWGVSLQGGRPRGPGRHGEAVPNLLRRDVVGEEGVGVGQPLSMVAAGEPSCQICIAGAGPAGMMLGLLLARSGIRVKVLEKHSDFFRDFRGDTIHPSTLEILENRERNRSVSRSEEHTSELQSRGHLVCRLLLEKKKK